MSDAGPGAGAGAGVARARAGAGGFQHTSEPLPAPIIASHEAAASQQLLIQPPSPAWGDAAANHLQPPRRPEHGARAGGPLSAPSPKLHNIPALSLTDPPSEVQQPCLDLPFVPCPHLKRLYLEDLRGGLDACWPDLFSSPEPSSVFPHLARLEIRRCGAGQGPAWAAGFRHLRALVLEDTASGTAGVVSEQDLAELALVSASRAAPVPPASRSPIQARAHASVTSASGGSSTGTAGSGSSSGSEAASASPSSHASRNPSVTLASPSSAASARGGRQAGGATAANGGIGGGSGGGGGGLVELQLLGSCLPRDASATWFAALARVTTLRSLRLGLTANRQQLALLQPLALLRVLHLAPAVGVGGSGGGAGPGQWGQASTFSAGSDAGLEMAAQSFPLLSHLNLNHMGSSGVTDVGVGVWMAQLTGLTRLELAGCSRVNNSGLATLTGLKLLQLVDVSQCLMISDSGLQALKGASRLAVLKLAGCWKVTFSPSVWNATAASGPEPAAATGTAAAAGAAAAAASGTAAAAQVQGGAGTGSGGGSLANAHRPAATTAMHTSISSPALLHHAALNPSPGGAPGQNPNPETGVFWPMLHTLDLQDTRVGDQGLGVVSCSFPSLKRLRLSRLWSVNQGRGLTYLAASQRLPQLTRLDLSQTNIGDVDCVPLSRLSSLLYLDLSDTHVGDTGVARLAPALRCLVVWRLSRLTRLSDDGLAAMASSAKGLRSLRVVYMRSCRSITEGAVLRLWDSLPGIQRMELEGSWFVSLPTIARLYQGDVSGTDAAIAKSLPLWSGREEAGLALGIGGGGGGAEAGLSAGDADEPGREAWHAARDGEGLEERGVGLGGRMHWLSPLT